MKKLIITAVIAVFGLIWMLYMSAALPIKTQHTSTTDYYNNDVSEQISADWERKAKAEWIEENGIYQANLTPQVNAEMYRYVEQKQAEINRTWSKQ